MAHAARLSPKPAPPPFLPCRNTAFVYIFAECLGGAIAAVLALVLYGPGPEHGGGHEADPLAVQLTGQGAAPKGERQGLISMAANGSSSAAQWNPRFG